MRGSVKRFAALVMSCLSDCAGFQTSAVASRGMWLEEKIRIVFKYNITFVWLVLICSREKEIQAILHVMNLENIPRRQLAWY